MASDPSKAADLADGRIALPPERAFVIQLRAPADGAGELFTGRAEHLASGLVARFATVAELIDFVQRALATQAGAE